MSAASRPDGGSAPEPPAGDAHDDHDHHDHDGHDHDHGEHDHDEHGHDDHGHGHNHAEHLRSTPLRRLTIAFVLTASFMFVEAIVGWMSNFLALVADAGHMLSAAAALALAIFAQRIATQTGTRARTYGFRRAEVLAAFANGIALALTAIWIFVE